MPRKTPTPQVVELKSTQPTKRSSGSNMLLQIGLINAPIKLHTGARSENISFNQLHKTCLAKLKQQAMTCPHCDVDVAGDEIVRGYATKKDQYVVLTDEEIEAQKPESSKIIVIDRFVGATEVDPIYYEKSQYLAPGDGGAQAYQLIRDILVKTKKHGIGRAMISGNSEVMVLIRPYRNGILLHTLFFQDELKQPPFPIDQLQVTSEEMRLAGIIVENKSAPFNPQDYSDGYASNVKALVASKMAGTAPVLPAKKTAPPTQNLLAALTAEAATAKSKKVA